MPKIKLKGSAKPKVKNKNKQFPDRIQIVFGKVKNGYTACFSTDRDYEDIIIDNYVFKTLAELEMFIENELVPELLLKSLGELREKSVSGLY